MVGEALIDVGDGCVVEVAAYDCGVVGVAFDVGADAVCLCASVGCGFAQFAHEHLRTIADGLAVRVDDGVGVFVFLFWAEVIAFEVVVDDEQAVAVAVNPAGEAVVGARRKVDVYGVAEEWELGKYGVVAGL